MTTRARYLVATMVGMAGCSNVDGNTFSNLTAEIAVQPIEVDFGDQVVPILGETTLFITNAGRIDLNVNLAIEEDDEGVFSLSEDDLTLDAGEGAELTVTFQPRTFVDFASTIVISSNDQDNPEVRVPLTGLGVFGPVPDIDVDPMFVDFGFSSGDAVTRSITIRNEGGAPLALGTIEQTGSGHITMTPDLSRGIIAPDTEFPVSLIWDPPEADTDGMVGESATITIPSDDPDDPTVEVQLIANGGGDFEFPVAVIDCDSTVDVPSVVELDGSGSNDPEGNLPLVYEWTLSSLPSGSTTELTSLAGSSTSFLADIVGTYEVTLVVTNSLGVPSAPAKCVMDGEPPDAVHIELTWDTSKADLDLHLAESGEDLFAVPGDVSWCNRAPSWGAGGTADDPRLDIDDRAGFGPENINIQTPETQDFTVRVHYFDDQGDGTVSARVKVYIDGDLKYDDSRLINRNKVWDVAGVSYPSGAVLALTDPGLGPDDLPNASSRNCN